MTTPRSSALKAKSALVAQRREIAIRLKSSGRDNTYIGRFLAADPAIREPMELDPDTGDALGWPQGYGADLYEKGLEPPVDYDLSRWVSQDISRALGERAKTLAKESDQMRALMHERAEAMITGVLDAATMGDPQAIAAAIKIMDQQAKMHGLYAPTRAQVDSKVEVERKISDADLLKLANAIAAGDQVALDDPAEDDA